MTFAVLKALHGIIGDAIDEIEAVYGGSLPPSPSTNSYASPPPSPSVYGSAPDIDFPALDAPFDPSSPSELLTSHPVITLAINRIVAAAGQISATVQTPFLTLSDASMGYHLPSCLRLLEASHTVEILREAGPNGLHVDRIAEKNGVDRNKLAHILRLLATHHILREIFPNVFTNNRISSLVDSGKSFNQIAAHPESKYRDTNGVCAFVGLCTDELNKSSAYLTEAYLPTADGYRPDSVDLPTRAPFNYAFDCDGVGFFGWLEGEGHSSRRDGLPPVSNPNRLRLERFGKAMTGTEGWEVPGAVLNGFDWSSLPRGGIVVDVGGGIGSTSMLLASAFSSSSSSPVSDSFPASGFDDDTPGLRFVIQDRPIVVSMGKRAWQAKCPELLENGIARFQVHDFFTPQPVRNASVFLLRVILHDWPDPFARRILLRLRDAATEETKLLIADFVLPLACKDDLGSIDDEEGLAGIQGAETMLAPAPLLPNLGKASANAYWMDLTMQVMFNGKERTLREVVSLCRSAGWKVIRVVKAPGSLFGHITAIPVPIPAMGRGRAGSGSTILDNTIGLVRPSLRRVSTDESFEAGNRDVLEQANSRCGTPTFGSSMQLSSLEETRAKFGGGFIKGLGRRLGVSSGLRPAVLKQSAGGMLKKKPNPLILSPSRSSQVPASPISRKMSFADFPASPTSSTSSSSRQVPSSPLTRLPRLSLGKRPSLANLFQRDPSPPPPLPSFSSSLDVDPRRTTPAQPLSPTSPLAPRLPFSRRPSVSHLSTASSSNSSLLPPPFQRLQNFSKDFLPLSPSQKKAKPKHHTHTHSLSAPIAVIDPKMSTNVAASPKLLPRTKSHVQLSPKALSRKRSESLISIGFPRPSSIEQEAAVQLGLGGSRMLKFDDAGSTSGDVDSATDLGGQSVRPAGSVLAEAARIENVFGAGKRLDDWP